MKPEAPKLWSDMTPEEKGALLLAAHEEKVIERAERPKTSTGWSWVADSEPQWFDYCAYRVRPEPKRATVALMADCHFIGTIDLIDGKPDPDSIRLVPWSVRR